MALPWDALYIQGGFVRRGNIGQVDIITVISTEKRIRHDFLKHDLNSNNYENFSIRKVMDRI